MSRVINAGCRFNQWLSGMMDYLCHHGRGMEWGIVYVKLSMAYTLILPGQTLNLKAYANVKSFGFTDEIVAVALIVLAVNHMIALIRNGGWKRSPIWRGVCCFLGALIFGAMWYLTQTSPMTTPTLSPSLLAGYVLLELLGCRRAGDDHRCLMQQ